MAFKIEVALKAEKDIAEAVDYIKRDSPASARKWFDELFLALKDLKASPERNPVIAESVNLKRSLRSIHHYSHRVIYEVQETRLTVYVVRVYHSARKPLKRKDLS